MSWKTWVAAALLAAAPRGAAGAPPAATFGDVPRDHWAYAAIERVAAAGVLEGGAGLFSGQQQVDRFQMAVVVARLLEHVAAAGGPRAAGLDARDIAHLEAMKVEFADILALLGAKLATLEDDLAGLRSEVDRRKMSGGGGAALGAPGLARAFTGFVSVALVTTGDGGAGLPPIGGFAGPVRSRYTATSADQTFFTLPQASIALDHRLGRHLTVHAQYDYQTDGASSGAGAGLAAGQGVGLNEATITLERLIGSVNARVGGFALPFQSWEVDGPFRTCTDTITPSAKNTFFEAIRVLGVELFQSRDLELGQLRWRFGVFNGADVPALGTPAPGIAAVAAVGGTLGTMSDAVGLGALDLSASFDGSVGYFVDLESAEDPDRHWGWRFGLFDTGGDPNAVPPVGVPPLGLANSLEIDGFQIGLWWKDDTFSGRFEFLDAQGRDNTPATFNFASRVNLETWYLSFGYHPDPRTSLTLRYDDWSSELNGAPATFGQVLEGHALTFALARRVGESSSLQVEWLSPEEKLGDPVPGVPPVQDLDDDLVQVRYKVWF